MSIFCKICLIALWISVGDAAKSEFEKYQEVGGKLQSIYEGSWHTKGVKQIVDSMDYVKLGGVDIYSSAYFASKPLVALVSQFSCGKTTTTEQIMLNSTYPGSYVAPQPSTDRFTLIVDGGKREDAAQHVDHSVGQPAAQARHSVFQRYEENVGSGFAQKVALSMLSREDAPVLEHITLLDTPGVLSHGKHEYDVLKVWSAISQHADQIYVFFDGAKSGDISEDYENALKELAASENKVTFLFNKADTAPVKHLLETYGGLMWQLGRIFPNNEPERIHFGSFWQKPCNAEIVGDEMCSVFDESKQKLIDDLQMLPLKTPERRVATFVQFLERLELMGELVNSLKDATTTSWSMQCVDVDRQGRDLTRVDGLNELYDHMVDQWKAKKIHTAVYPRKDLFVKAVMQAGGPCNLKRWIGRHLESLRKAREEANKIFSELDLQVPKTTFEKLGFSAIAQDPNPAEFSPRQCQANSITSKCE